MSELLAISLVITAFFLLPIALAWLGFHGLRTWQTFVFQLAMTPWLAALSFTNAAFSRNQGTDGDGKRNGQTSPASAAPAGTFAAYKQDTLRQLDEEREAFERFLDEKRRRRA